MFLFGILISDSHIRNQNEETERRTMFLDDQRAPSYPELSFYAHLQWTSTFSVVGPNNRTFSANIKSCAPFPCCQVSYGTLGLWGRQGRIKYLILFNT